MSRRYWWRTLMVSGLFVLVCGQGAARAQTQDIGPGIVDRGKPLTIREIRKLLERTIDTKDLQMPLPLKAALNFLEDMLSDHGKKNLRIVLHDGAFMKEDPEAPDVATTKVRLPPFPKRLSMATALRFVLSKVVTNNATYRLRAGQIQVTTVEDAASAQLSELVQGSYKDRSLVEVLNQLAEQSGVTIVVDRRVSKQAQVSVRARLGGIVYGVPLRTALRLLTDMATLRFVAVGNVVYVTSPANAEKVIAEQKRRSQFSLLRLEGDPEEGGPLGFAEYERVSLEDQVINRPLAAALEGLAEQAGASLVIDQRVRQKAKATVAARLLNGVSLETALRLLTDMADLSYLTVDGVIYVTSPANARKLERQLREELRKKKPATPKAKPIP